MEENLTLENAGSDMPDITDAGAEEKETCGVESDVKPRLSAAEGDENVLLPTGEIKEESGLSAVNEGEQNGGSEIPVTDPALPDYSAEIEGLKAEIGRLREELQSRRELDERLTAEYAEFCELYPGQSLSDLPECVWENVRRGMPLAAAFAYEEARRQRLEEKAAEINRRNTSLSSGSLDARCIPDHFSPAEVRAMSAAEVRANYAKIIESMKHWN